MNLLKTLIAPLSIVLALASSNVFANESKEKILAGGEATVAKMEEAVNLLNNNGSKEDVIAALGEARNLQKEFRYEITERTRQKATDRLKVGRELLKDGKTEEAKAAINESFTMFKEMLAIYKQNH